MTTTRVLLAAAFVSVCVSTAVAQVPVAPAPPVAPVAPVAPVPAPLPRQVEPHSVFTQSEPHFLDIDHFDLEEITRNAREIAESMKDVHLFAQGAQPFVQPPLPPQAPLPPMQMTSFRYGGNDAGENLYERGRNFIDNNQYDRAVSTFDQLIGQRTNKTEAATYWKA